METGALLSSDLMGSTGWFNPSYGIPGADASFSSAGSTNAAPQVRPVITSILHSQCLALPQLLKCPSTFPGQQICEEGWEMVSVLQWVFFSVCDSS